MTLIKYQPALYRPLTDGEIIQCNDVVLDDMMVGNPQPIFAIGPNHPEIGNAYEDGGMNTIMRKRIDNQGSTIRSCP